MSNADAVYLIGGSHDCLKILVDTNKCWVEMLKRFHPEIGIYDSRVNRPILAEIERYRHTHTNKNGTRIFELVEVEK